MEAFDTTTMSTGTEEPQKFGRHISLGVAITSAPRVVPTLVATVDSMRTAGFTQPIELFIDGQVSVPLDDMIRINPSSVRLGEIKNWVRASRFMLSKGYEFVLICQDDVQFCLHAYTTLETGILRFKGERLGLISLYTPRANVLGRDFRKMDEGWHRFTPSRNTWGALAWCFPKRVLETLTAMPDFEQAASREELLDRLVCGILSTMRIVCFQHIPSLAKHIGQTSTLKHKDNPGKDAVRFNPLGGLNF